MDIRAAVLYDYGQALVVEDLVLDPPQTGEVQIRVAASGICHSDVNIITGDAPAPLPIVLGHEVAGVVEAVGEGVTRVRPGDRVAVSLLRSCGRCFYCQHGQPNSCEGEFALNRSTRLHKPDGTPITQGISVGGFAEGVVVDQSQVIPVPDDVPLESAALIGCGVITGVGAVINTAQIEVGTSVVVVGIGGVGVNAIQGAVLAGARHVIAVDLLDSKLDTAKAFGATHTINAAQADAAAAVKQLTAGRGADYVFVTVGSERAVAQSFSLIRKHGTVVLIGLIFRDGAATAVPLPVTDIVLNGAQVLGSFMGSTRLGINVPDLIELYQQQRLQLDALVTNTYALDQINEAVAQMERGEVIRNVIVL